MPTPLRGEVWLIDFGMTGKARPALVVSVTFGDQDRALITVIPHTTALRGSPFEIAVRVPFLRPGAFLVQGAALAGLFFGIREVVRFSPTAAP